MSELSELYQELILDHNARPRNFGVMATPSHEAEGTNPLCGDHVMVFLKLEGEHIKEVQFDGKGCAISKASASLMTQRLRGKTLTEAQAIFAHFHDMVTADPDDEPEDAYGAHVEPSLAAPHADAQAQAEAKAEARSAALGKLEALAGVRGFPMRIKCATLAWHTFNAALSGRGKKVSTEDAQDLNIPEATSIRGPQ